MRHVQHGLFALALLLGASYVVAQGPPPFELKPRPLSAGGVVNNPLLLADGSATTPSLTFASETGMGFFRSGSASVVFAQGGGNIVALTGTTFRIRSDATLGFTSADALAGNDVVLARGAAGLLSLTNADGTPDLNLNVSGSPTLSTCGDGALATGSSNTSGRVTGTTQTACTLTFSASFGGNSADCLINNMTAEGQGHVSATSETAFTVSLLTAGDDFSYFCVGR